MNNKPPPPPGLPTITQRVAALQLATRFHSSSSSSCAPRTSWWCQTRATKNTKRRLLTWRPPARLRRQGTTKVPAPLPWDNRHMKSSEAVKIPLMVTFATVVDDDYEEGSTHASSTSMFRKTKNNKPVQEVKARRS
jgi:hypothetical protein